MTTPGMILCNTPMVADATVKVHAAAAATEQNRQAHLAIMARDAENFGGVGSDAYQAHCAQVNAHYDAHQEAIAHAGRALGLANDGFTTTDGQCAAQYAV